MKNSTWTIIRKELLRVFTDKRLVFTTFVLPALSLAIIYSIMGNMIATIGEDRQAHVPKVVVFSAPADFLDIPEDVNVIIPEPGDSPANYVEGVKQGQVDMVLQFPENFEADVTNYKQAGLPDVKTLYNPSEDFSREARKRMVAALTTYETMLLGERFGNEAYASAFDIDREGDNRAVDEAKATGKGLGSLLPMLISIFLFSGAMSIGIDSIAGEKERGTMATMLITPVSRQSIIYGKIVSLAVVAIMTAISSFVGILASFPFSSSLFAGTSGTSNVSLGALSFGFEHIFMLFALMFTLAIVYVGLILSFSMFAKTVKEAGLYVTPIYMIIMIAGFSTMFAEGGVASWQYAIPVYGTIIAMKSLLTLELTWGLFGMTVGGSVLSIAILVYFIQKLFDNEKVLFGV